MCLVYAARRHVQGQQENDPYVQHRQLILPLQTVPEYSVLLKFPDKGLFVGRSAPEEFLATALFGSARRAFDCG